MFLVEERLAGESFGQQLERSIIKEDFESFRELYIKFEKLYDSFVKILDKHKISGDVGLFDFFIKANKLIATDLLLKSCKRCEYLTFKQLAKIELNNKIANEFIEKITTEKIYDTSSNLYFESRWKNCQDIFEKIKQVIIDELQPKPDDKILDVGCGPGTWTRVFKEFSANVTGIDISEEMLKIAKKNVEAKFLQCSGDDTPFERDFFDKIVCVRVFEYFQNKQKAVNEFHRILKPNGRVAIVTKSPYFIIRTFFRIKMVLRDLRWLRRVYDKEYGVLYFQEYIAPRELENILKRANFKNIKHYPVTYYLDKPRMTTVLEICSKIFSFAYYLFCESYIIVAIKDEKSKKSSHIKQTPK
jgi:ubiquinone/menaquinone biosynthesis C-methylase UbiE